MDAGALASILGRGDFSKFAENLLDVAIKEYYEETYDPRRLTAEITRSIRQ